MNSFDLTILRGLNGLAGRSHIFDVLVATFSAYAPVIFGVLFAIYFFLPGTDRPLRRRILMAGLGGILAVVASVVIAMFVYRARPFAALPPGQVHLLLPHTPDSSFPSDHAMGSGAFAAGMWGAPNRTAPWIFTLAALLVGTSRLIAGVHWPTDIIASLVLGGLIARATLALERPLSPLLGFIVGLVERIEGHQRPQAGR